MSSPQQKYRMNLFVRTTSASHGPEPRSAWANLAYKNFTRFVGTRGKLRPAWTQKPAESAAAAVRKSTKNETPKSNQNETQRRAHAIAGTPGAHRDPLLDRNNVGSSRCPADPCPDREPCAPPPRGPPRPPGPPGEKRGGGVAGDDTDRAASGTRWCEEKARLWTYVRDDRPWKWW